MTSAIEHASPGFCATLAQALSRYRATVGDGAPARCRLVHYVGADTPYGLDVPPERIEHDIASALAEGFVVDWLFEHRTLWLCLQEPGCPLPPWDKVKAEEALIDVDALLRDAGLE